MALVPSPTYIAPPSGNTNNKQRRKKEKQSRRIIAGIQETISESGGRHAEGR